jgi:hypothetical protein
VGIGTVPGTIPASVPVLLVDHIHWQLYPLWFLHTGRRARRLKTYPVLVKIVNYNAVAFNLYPSLLLLVDLLGLCCCVVNGAELLSSTTPIYVE